MENYKTLTKKGRIESRVYVDSGRYVIYGYESDGKLSNKLRVVLNGHEKRSFFLINTARGKSLALDAAYEDDVNILKDGKSSKVSDLFHA